MYNDEFEILRQNYTKSDIIKFDKSRLIIDIKSEVTKLDRVIIRRNRREYIAGALVVLLFGAGALFFTEFLSRLSMVMGVLYGVMVILVLKNVKSRRPEDPTLPTMDYLIKYRQYLVKERNLLANILYWYLLPPYIICLLFFIGQKTGITMLAVNMLVITALYSFIFYLNKKGGKKAFNPIIKKIDEALMMHETQIKH